MYLSLNNNNDEPTSKLKWQQIYFKDEVTWDKIFATPFKYNLSVQQQWFQIRKNHRILLCKKYLYTLKLNSSPLCSFCDQEETLVHMFWTCATTQLFLNKLRDCFSM